MNNYLLRKAGKVTLLICIILMLMWAIAWLVGAIFGIAGLILFMLTVIYVAVYHIFKEAKWMDYNPDNSYHKDLWDKDKVNKSVDKIINK